MLDSTFDATLLDLLRACEASARAPETERYRIVPCGPFLAQIDTVSAIPWLNTVVPVEPAISADDVLRGIEESREVFAAHARQLRFEFSDVLWPELPALLESAGLRLEARQPMMACLPGDLRPREAPGVSLHELRADNPDEFLGAFQSIRYEEHIGSPSPYAPAEVIGTLRESLRQGSERCMLATVGGTYAGTGAIGAGDSSEDGVAEVVGIVTVPELRRRGVAATVTSALVRRHFAEGGRIAWLSAEDAGARALYASIGFRDIAAWLNYRAQE